MKGACAVFSRYSARPSQKEDGHKAGGGHLPPLSPLHLLLWSQLQRGGDMVLQPPYVHSLHHTLQTIGTALCKSESADADVKFHAETK